MPAHLTVRAVNFILVFRVICFGSSWTCMRILVTLLCSLAVKAVTSTTVTVVGAIKPVTVAVTAVAVTVGTMAAELVDTEVAR